MIRKLIEDIWYSHPFYQLFLLNVRAHTYTTSSLVEEREERDVSCHREEHEELGEFTILHSQ